jgi:hypothetical protein
MKGAKKAASRRTNVCRLKNAALEKRARKAMAKEEFDSGIECEIHFKKTALTNACCNQ